MDNSPIEQRVTNFAKARQDFKESAQQVADKFGYSREYIYEVLKYPNKNTGLFQKIAAYIQSAGYEVPESSASRNKVATN